MTKFSIKKMNKEIQLNFEALFLDRFASVFGP